MTETTRTQQLRMRMVSAGEGLQKQGEDDSPDQKDESSGEMLLGAPSK